MADPETIPDSQVDTQATYDPAANEIVEDSQPTQNLTLNESQDFCLVAEDSQKETEIESHLEENKNESTDKDVKESEDEHKSTTLDNIKVETVSEHPAKKEDVRPTEDEKKKEEVEAVDDDDDDFVPCSQQDTVSPMKKQIAGLSAGISQKRKAEATEESAAKFPRTCLEEDALSSARKKLDEEEDLLETELDISTEEKANVIIDETQEMCTKENEPETLQQVAKELEEALSQQDEDSVMSVDEADKTSAVEKRLAEEKMKPTTEVPEEKKVVESTEEEACQEEKPSNRDAAKETDKKAEEESTVDQAATRVEKEPIKRDVIGEEKSVTVDRLNKEKSSTAETEDEKKCAQSTLVEEKQSSHPQDVDEKESSKAEGEKLKSSLENSVTPMEVSNEDKALKSSLNSSQGSKDSSKLDTTSEDAIKENSVSDNKLDSPTKTKDKNANSAERNPTRRSDDSGISLQTPESSNKSQQEITIPSIPVPSSKSRMSIEVIYDKATAPPEKKRPRELVEIDEDGEKIVLDSSQEGCDKSMEKGSNDSKIETSYKTCDSKAGSTDYKSVDTSKDSNNDYKSGYSLTNGSTALKKTDSDQTASFGSDIAVEPPMKKMETLSATKKARLAPEVLISISDSEGDSFVSEERKSKVESTNRENATIKIVEKELSVLVKLKCLVHIDETTKEHVEKVITSVQSEPTVVDYPLTRRRNSDASACLADISGNAGDNRDTSPGSVTSNAQPYHLNSRLSLASMVSSSSSSSAASLNAKLTAKTQFQLPRIPKHTKKSSSELVTPDGKTESIESLEQLSKEWKNVGLLLNSFFNCAREELLASDLHNGSTERVDNSMERILSSTPEVEQKDNKQSVVTGTPKNASKRSRSTKRSRSKTVRPSGSNGLTKTTSPVAEAEPVLPVHPVHPGTPSSSRKRKSSPEISSRQSTNTKDTLNDTSDELVGKEVFAKWSDNKYYPGTVIGKTKTKFKVNFYDGQHKLIIEDFIVPMPTTLHVGLSVYATSADDDYGSCGIIVDTKKAKDSVIYKVQTDEQEELSVGINNIFLTNDQVQVLREETKEMKTPPSTPKHLGKVTLDNVVDGKRRSKRITTPVALTPKTKRARGSLVDKIADASKPSASGVVATKTKVEANYDTTSDSNYSALEETDLLGVQPELVGTPNEQEGKGPASRMKGKTRSRKKAEDPETVAKLGPIPPANSNIFSGMSFLLTCASLEIIDRFQSDTKDSNSDPGTENEEEWTRKPFVRDRLIAQINAGGGKVYETFEQIPQEEYERTKLITNVPNLTKKSLLCLSVGIKAYNHQWIIRCCKENKVVNPSEEELPAGWSLMKQSYVEMYERRNKKPFQTLPVIVVIPLIPGEKDFVTFWTQICQNAGGAVLLPESPGDIFIEGTVVLTNKRCPSWVIEKSKNWSIPVVSTTWVIQSLIEGNICTYDAHPSFEYNHVKRPPSHISNLKRLH